MRHVHPAAIAGLLLNVFLIYVIFSFFDSIDISMIPQQNQAAVSMVLDTLPTMRPLYFAIVAGQAIALALILMKISLGIIVAGVTSFLMLPASLVYFVGCLLTREQVRYAGFPLAPADYAQARIFPSAAGPRMRSFTAGVSLAALVCLLLGFGDFTLVLLSLMILGFYFIFRSRSHQALSIHDTYFTLWPNIFAPRLLIPFDAVRLATLDNDDTIELRLETPYGPAVVRWSLASVAAKARRSAVESLGAAFESRNIPLR